MKLSDNRVLRTRNASHWKAFRPGNTLNYVLRANQFIKAAGGRDTGELEVEEIGSILDELGRGSRMADWQFGQLVDSVRVLLSVHLTSNISKNVDWPYWKGSARNVSGDHATTAREHSPDELVYLKVKKGSGELGDIRSQHGD